MNTKYLLWLEHLDPTDSHLVGEKAIALGQLSQAGFPVPKGFVLTTDAFNHFLESNKLQEKIIYILSTLDAGNPEDLLLKSSQIKKLIVTSPFPEILKSKILSHYAGFSKSAFWTKNPHVTLKSHLKDSETVSGEANLANKIREFWASEFDPHLLHSHANRPGHILVQKKVHPEISGVFYSSDPETGDKTKLLLSVGPDRYEINRRNPSLVDPQILSGQKIPRPLMNQLIDLFLRLEKHHYFPLKAEFAIENGEIHLLDLVPLTVRPEAQELKFEEPLPTVNQREVILGLPGSPGRRTAPAKVVKHPQDAAKKIFPGDILVTGETNNHFLHVMRKASAIITEKGDRHSHAAVFAKHRGIPSLVGMNLITSKIKDGQVITVDGLTGEVIL